MKHHTFEIIIFSAFISSSLIKKKKKKKERDEKNHRFPPDSIQNCMQFRSTIFKIYSISRFREQLSRADEFSRFKNTDDRFIFNISLRRIKSQ